MSAGDRTPPSAPGSCQEVRPDTVVHDQSGRAGGRSAGLTVLVDLVAPIALFYGLRSAGASVYVALLAGGAPPGLHAVIEMITAGRVDRLAAGVLVMLAISAGVSLIAGGPRFLLAKDGLLTATWGAWMLVSVWDERPLTFVFSRPLLEGHRLWNPARRRWTPTTLSWDELWRRLPRFRRAWRLTTVIWGVAMLIDAVARVTMAYTLPIDSVPGLGGMLWPVTFVLLQIVTNIYFARAGMWQMLHGEQASSTAVAAADG